MEEIKMLLIEKWPEILNYVLTAVAYFFFLLYRSKFNKTKDNVLTAFKDKVGEVIKTDENAKSELKAAIDEYNKSRKEFEALIIRIKKTEAALINVIEEELLDE